ncbi:hypothetical protein [Mycolicibacterium sp. 624]|uniref:hypothetical protein n=1 Tax=Mycolicibacterium sp. 624 TaxID=3156314 RepID=UPI0033999EA3
MKLVAAAFSCNAVHRAGGGLDDIGAIDGLNMDDELAFVSRPTRLLSERLRRKSRATGSR